MITKINTSDIPGRKTTHNNPVSAEILQFHKSGWDACEVNISHYKSAKTARNAYDCAVKKLKVGVAVMMRNDRLFLARTSDES